MFMKAGPLFARGGGNVMNLSRGCTTQFHLIECLFRIALRRRSWFSGKHSEIRCCLSMNGSFVSVLVILSMCRAPLLPSIVRKHGCDVCMRNRLSASKLRPGRPQQRSRLIMGEKLHYG